MFFRVFYGILRNPELISRAIVLFPDTTKIESLGTGVRDYERQGLCH
jgi:hypothetical protein